MAELRIVAGAWRGRRITVPSEGVRPTADRVREAWMSIVQRAIPDARTLDLCAGSGALGLEALSRGATHCDFVEKDARTLRLLQENLAALGAEARATVHREDALRFLEAADASPLPAAGADSAPPSPRWELAFADPPYRQGLAAALADRWLAAPFATIFGVEHEAALSLPAPTDDRRVDRRVYGETAITIYRLAP